MHQTGRRSASIDVADDDKLFNELFGRNNLDANPNLHPPVQVPVKAEEILEPDVDTTRKELSRKLSEKSVLPNSVSKVDVENRINGDNGEALITNKLLNSLDGKTGRLRDKFGECQKTNKGHEKASLDTMERNDDENSLNGRLVSNVKSCEDANQKSDFKQKKVETKLGDVQSGEDTIEKRDKEVEECNLKERSQGQINMKRRQSREPKDKRKEREENETNVTIVEDGELNKVKEEINSEINKTQMSTEKSSDGEVSETEKLKDGLTEEMSTKDTDTDVQILNSENTTDRVTDGEGSNLDNATSNGSNGAAAGTKRASIRITDAVTVLDSNKASDVSASAEEQNNKTKKGRDESSQSSVDDNVKVVKSTGGRCKQRRLSLLERRRRRRGNSSGSIVQVPIL